MQPHGLRRRKVQVTLTLMVGSEPWVLVAGPEAHFKVPASTTVGEVLQGALEGWQSTPRRARQGEATVRVPLSEWIRLNANGQRSGCD